MRVFFRLLRLGVRPSLAAFLAAVWGFLIRFWWVWPGLLVLWLIIQPGK